MEAKCKTTKKRDLSQLTIARAVLRTTTTQATVTLKKYGKPYGDLDLGSLTNVLSE